MVMVHLPYTRIYDLIINVCVFMYTIWRRDNFAELIALVYKQKQQQQQFNVHKKRDHKVIKNEHETKTLFQNFPLACGWKCVWFLCRPCGTTNTRIELKGTPRNYAGGSQVPRKTYVLPLWYCMVKLFIFFNEANRNVDWICSGEDDAGHDGSGAALDAFVRFASAMKQRMITLRKQKGCKSNCCHIPQVSTYNSHIQCILTHTHHRRFKIARSLFTRVNHILYNLESCLSKSARARSSSLIPESAVWLGIVWRESNLKDKEDTRLRPRSKNTITEKEIADDRRDVTPRECSKRVYSIFSLSFCE